MPQIDIQEYRTATAMLADWAEWLEQNAANNNLLLGFLYRLQRREAAGGEVVALMVGISEAGQRKLALFQTAPRELILVCAPTGWESALAAGVEWMQLHHSQFAGNRGPRAAGQCLCRCLFSQMEAGFSAKYPATRSIELAKTLRRVDAACRTT